MPTILLDTDFLSSFLKIDRCDLIRSLYQIDQAYIPAAVHRELAQTELLTELLAVSWINVWLEEPPSDEGAMQDPRFGALGSGEQACILLARGLDGAVLLTSDNLARRFAQSLGLVAISIPAFLMACKLSGLVDREQMVRIIEDLRFKDYYEFRAEIRELLLT